MFCKKSITVFLITALLNMQLVGCASVHDISDLRGLPRASTPEEYKGLYYDPSILAYRTSDDENGSTEDIKALRDYYGRKIQNEEDLARIKNAYEAESKVLDRGHTASKTVLGVFYVTVSTVFLIIEAVVTFPWQIMIQHRKAKLKEEAENAYVAGRDNFEQGHIDDALGYWERARAVMPSLVAFSDIEYWRGRAFEAQGKLEEAKNAYEMFLNYSERTVPEYFEEKYEDDPSWLEKAKDAQKSIAGKQEQ